MTPTPADILAARQTAGLTRAQAARASYAAVRTWHQWETGKRRMPVASWMTFLHRTNARDMSRFDAAHNK